VDPCSVTTFLDDEYDKNVPISDFTVTLPEISDYWSTDALYNDPSLCEKVLHLFDWMG
jgi:hypothetical protein